MEGGGGVQETIQQLPRPRLFVGGLKMEATGLFLQEHFREYGTLKDCFICYNKETGLSRTFGFVEFEDPAVAQRVLQDRHFILGQKADVSVAKERNLHNRNDSKKIFVGGLPPAVTQQELRSFFERFGTVTDAVLVHDRITRALRGFGFVTFESKDSADAALQSRYHEFKGRRVEVKRANNPIVRNSTTVGNNVGYYDLSVDQTGFFGYGSPDCYYWYHHCFWNMNYPYYEFPATNYYAAGSWYSGYGYAEGGIAGDEIGTAGCQIADHHGTQHDTEDSEIDIDSFDMKNYLLDQEDEADGSESDIERSQPKLIKGSSSGVTKPISVSDHPMLHPIIYKLSSLDNTAPSLSSADTRFVEMEMLVR